PFILIDDDIDFLETLKRRLTNIGFKKVRTEREPVKAASLFEKGGVFDIAMIDMTMPGMDGIELLETIKNISPRTECIMVTAVNEARVAVECLNKGAYDYLVKPIPQEDLVFAMKRTLERKRLLDILDIEKSKALPQLIHPEPFQPIITRSEKVLRVLKEAELHAASDVPILITGESGTGKELLARAIHTASPRASFPFTPVNMANLSGSLFEAEFFGHTRGAFTGAENGRVGYLEHTDKGTLFLDEIGNLPLEIQGKLLRVLQDGEYLKLGTSSYLTADVRFIAATNEALDKMMAKRLFRKDLYYRIRGGWLHLPPLRERQEDIPLLANTFLQDYRDPDSDEGIEEEAMCLLMEYNYPGNVRELRSIIQSAVNLAQDRPISSQVLPGHLRRRRSTSRCENKSDAAIVSLSQVEKSHILKVYHHTNQNKSQTARLLGIGLNTLRRKLKSYNVE
ncbi:MAG: sigma-54-dependent Fis family transcriptional regulator, partial [Desulfobacterales bacterium]